VFHRTFRGVVKKNLIYDNGQVPKDGHDQASARPIPPASALMPWQDVKEATDWMQPLSKTRQPYSGLVLNNADGVKVFGNKVRARYDDDFAFTMENDDGNNYKVKKGGNNKNCRGKVDSNLNKYVSDASQTECNKWFPQ
jgi:hypothetical protein